MIEESFVRLYAHDFRQFAARAELGQDVESALLRRLGEARAHSAIMDARKGSDHLAALVSRLRDEASQFAGRPMLKGADPVQAAKRHRQFLGRVADLLSRPAGEETSAPATSGRLTRRASRPTLREPSRPEGGRPEGGSHVC